MKLGLLGGNTKAKILDLRRECGTMLKLLDFAEYFVASNIRREFIIGETGMYRKEIPKIPAEAIREAVANALCHRDYETGAAVEVNVFMDTVQIVSPGPFPEGDSPQEHLDGTASEFCLRNPAIAHALFRAGVIEQYGTGIPRIKETCEAAGVRFRFEQTVNSTVVVFERPGSQKATFRIAADNRPLLSEREQAAMAIAAAQGKITTSDLAREAGVGRKNGREDPERPCRTRPVGMVRKKPERPAPVLQDAKRSLRLQGLAGKQARCVCCRPPCWALLSNLLGSTQARVGKSAKVQRNGPEEYIALDQILRK